MASRWRLLTRLPRRLFLRLSMSKYTDHPIHYTGTGRPTCESKATRSGSVVAPHLSGYPLERCAPHMNEWVAGPHGRLVRDSLGHYLTLLVRWGTGKAISDWIGGLRNFALLQFLHRIKSHISGKSFRVEVDGEETGVVVGRGDEDAEVERGSAAKANVMCNNAYYYYRWRRRRLFPTCRWPYRDFWTGRRLRSVKEG